MLTTSNLVGTDQELYSWSFRGPAGLGFLAIAVTVSAFLAWSTLMPLASAVLTSGVVVTDGSNKVIQSAELGVVDRVAVKDGDTVSANQPVIMMNSSQQVSSITVLEKQICMNHAQQARLRAEMTDSAQIIYPDQVHGVDLRRYQEILEDQNEELKTRRTALKSHMDEIGTERQALNASLVGVDGQITALRTRQALIRQSLVTAVQLSNDGIGSKRAVRDALSETANLNGDIADLSSRRLDLEAQVSRSYVEERRLRTSSKESGNTELQRLAAEEQELFLRVDQARISFARSVLRSPVAGTVMNLSVHTVGGVILPGVPLLEVVPKNGFLVIEAKIRPLDVNDVKIGSPVLVRLEGGGLQQTADINGRVESITADRLSERDSEDGFFLARVSVDCAQVSATQGVDLRPGSPVTLMILKKNRTLASYLLGPLIDGLSHSLRE